MPAPAGAGLGILFTTPQGILLDIQNRVAIKRAVTTGGVPTDFINDFKNLWKGITEFLDE